MEYHAAQIELMKIVGFETVETVASFSMEDSIAEMNETVQQYVNNIKFTGALHYEKNYHSRNTTYDGIACRLQRNTKRR